MPSAMKAHGMAEKREQRQGLSRSTQMMRERGRQEASLSPDYSERGWKPPYKSVLCFSSGNYERFFEESSLIQPEFWKIITVVSSPIVRWKYHPPHWVVLRSK